jgi:hypothetical protein
MGGRRIYANLVGCVPGDPLILARLERIDGFGIYHQLYSYWIDWTNL